MLHFLNHDLRCAKFVFFSCIWPFSVYFIFRRLCMVRKLKLLHIHCRQLLWTSRGGFSANTSIYLSMFSLLCSCCYARPSSESCLHASFSLRVLTIIPLLIDCHIGNPALAFFFSQLQVHVSPSRLYSTYLISFLFSLCEALLFGTVNFHQLLLFDLHYSLNCL